MIVFAISAGLPHRDWRCFLLMFLLAVDALSWRPAGDFHRLILDPRRAVGIPVYERVCQKPPIIAGRIVGALVSPAGFGTPQGRVHDGLGYVEHESQFQRGLQFRVEGVASIVEEYVLETRLQFAQTSGSFRQLAILTVDACTGLDRFLHLVPKRGDPFLAAGLAQELGLQAALFVLSLGERVSVRLRSPACVFGSSFSSPRAEH